MNVFSNRVLIPSERLMGSSSVPGVAPIAFDTHAFEGWDSLL